MRSLTTLLYGVTLLASLIVASWITTTTHALALQEPTAAKDESTPDADPPVATPNEPTPVEASAAEETPAETPTEASPPTDTTGTEEAPIRVEYPQTRRGA